VFGGHQQGQREAVQGAFGRALPRALAVTDAQQFPGVRQRRFRDARSVTQPTAELELGEREQVGAGLQAAQFFADLGQPRVEFGAGDGQLCPAFLQLIGLFAELIFHFAEPGFVGVEEHPVLGRPQPQVLRGLRVGVEALPLGPGLDGEPRDVGVDGGEPAAAVGADVLLHGGQLVPPPGDLGAQLGAVFLEPPAGALQLRLVFQAQLQLPVREPGMQLVPLLAGQLVLVAQLRVLCGALLDRRQQGDLVLGPEHGLVGFLQVVEVVDKFADAFGDVVLLQHVGAHEGGDVLHLLHGHRAVEQLHGLVAADAELPFEGGGVGLEGVVDGSAGGAELLLELRRVLAEVREVRRDGLVRLSQGVEAAGLAGFLRGPEGDGQGDRLAQHGVVEDGEHHGQGAGASQRHGFGVLAAGAARALVEAAHVRHQRAFLLLRAGRLVVLDPVGGQQQGGDGVHHRRLPRADVTGEEAVGAVQPERPHALVEGAPVEQLQTVQPEARGSAAVVRLFLQAEQGVLQIRGHLLSSSAAPAPGVPVIGAPVRVAR
jgi:hypothetical protein